MLRLEAAELAVGVAVDTLLRDVVEEGVPELVAVVVARAVEEPPARTIASTDRALSFPEKLKSETGLVMQKVGGRKDSKDGTVGRTCARGRRRRRCR